jgi:hypothetical protein
MAIFTKKIHPAHGILHKSVQEETSGDHRIKRAREPLRSRELHYDAWWQAHTSRIGFDELPSFRG